MKVASLLEGIFGCPLGEGKLVCWVIYKNSEELRTPAAVKWGSESDPVHWLEYNLLKKIAKWCKGIILNIYNVEILPQ